MFWVVRSAAGVSVGEPWLLFHISIVNCTVVMEIISGSSNILINPDFRFHIKSSWFSNLRISVPEFSVLLILCIVYIVEFYTLNKKSI